MAAGAGAFVLRLGAREARGFAGLLGPGPADGAVALEAEFAGRKAALPAGAAAPGGKGWAWGPAEGAAEWRLSLEELRALESRGRTSCKVSALFQRAGTPVGRPEREVLGYVMLDLRTAKLNARHGDRRGTWYALMGLGGRAKEAGSPELRLVCTFKEDLKGRGAAAEREEAVEARASADSAPGEAARPAEPAEPAPAPLAAAERAATPGPSVRSSLEPDDPARKFRFSVDLRSFKSSRKLPLNQASCVFKMLMPQELTNIMGSGASVAPLRTYPPAELSRGSEVAIPNGYLAVEFSCKALTLATLLSSVPRVLVEVYNRERFAADAQIGAASVPLDALLSDPWIDGYAPVLALESGGGSTETVQIGAVRVIIAVEDLGPILYDEGEEAEGARAGAPAGGPTEPSDQKAAAAPKSPFAAAGSQEKAGAPAPQKLPPPEEVQELPARADGKSQGAAQGRGAEYQAAWEFEVWRAAEEARFRAELKEKEVTRMAALESEWRRHEKARTEEVASLRAECESLQKKLHASLSSAEERERKLVTAEESLTRRRKEIERQAAARAAEAQTTIRRVQEECEHQIQMEKIRSSELGRLKRETEERLREGQARVKTLEKEFDDYRHKVRATPEAKLQAEVVRLQQKLALSEGRQLKLQSAKQHYKDQVIRLARELARVQLSRNAQAAAQLQRHTQEEGLRQLRSLAEQEAAASEDDRLELQRTRRDLDTLVRAATGPPAGRGEVAENAPHLTLDEKEGGAGESAQDEVQRLIAERAGLLQTGVYKAGDPVIAALDSKLQTLSAA